MTTLFVTYRGGPSTRFDRGYYVEEHLPRVTAAWGPYGLQNIAAFFPSGDGAGTIAVCVCEFRDDRAMNESLRAPETQSVMDDVKQFTDAAPIQMRGNRLEA